MTFSEPVRLLLLILVCAVLWSLESIVPPPRAVGEEEGSPDRVESRARLETFTRERDAVLAELERRASGALQV